MKNSVFTVLVMLLCAGAFAQSAGSLLLDCRQAGAFRKAFTTTADRGTWKVAREGFVGRTPRYYDLPEAKRDDHVDDSWTYFNVRAIGMWSYALAGETAWTNYTLATTVRILQPAPLAGPRPGDVFFNYQWGREAVGTDAAIVLRYQNPDNNYMLRLSSDYGHLELWKTHGGVVQVKPFPFKPETDYLLTVTVSGPWIIAAINGQEVLRYADPIDPILSGKIGLAVRESAVRFSNLSVTPATMIKDPVPAHKADFHLRKWVGRDYIFDGDEPVAYCWPESGGDGGGLHEMKFVPGLMPMIIEQFGACWSGGIWDRQKGGQVQVTQEGAVFKFTVTLTDRTSGAFEDVCDWSLSYDPARGYVWDKHVKLTVRAEKNGLYKWGFNISDALFYQAVAPGTDKLPLGREEGNDNWAIYTRPDGKFTVFPVHHFYPGLMTTWEKRVVKKGGVWAHRVDRWGVVTEFSADSAYQYWGDYCAWGLDLHFTPTLAGAGAKLEQPKKGDIFEDRVRFYLWNPQETALHLRQGIPIEGDSNYLLSQLFAHVEPVNHFDDVYPLAISGHSKQMWNGNYAIDRHVGHGDACSMRIDAGGTPPNVLIGPSFRTGPYLAPRYRFGAWVKAENFTGKFTLKCDNYSFQKPRDAKPTLAELPITGHCDWTYLSFTTDLPRYAHAWYLRLEPVGTGTVWVDDVEVAPIWK